MPHIMPQISLQRVISEGIEIVKNNIDVLDDIFQFYLIEEMADDYGQNYIDNIKTWFTETEIPVVQAWSLDPQRAPQISIHLATEVEDESKAAIGDHWGFEDDSGVEIGVTPFTVMLDIGCHTSRAGDEVLWLYYIVSYILFKRKRTAEKLGLQLQTYNASDYNKDMKKLADNIWTRWIRFRATVQNFWDSRPVIEIGDIEVTVDRESANDSTLGT